jgi:hypothetical protein
MAKHTATRPANFFSHTQLAHSIQVVEHRAWAMKFILKTDKELALGKNPTFKLFEYLFSITNKICDHWFQ